jgi:hypothetical protein
MKIKIQRDYFKEFWFSDFNFSNSSSWEAIATLASKLV